MVKLTQFREIRERTGLSVEEVALRIGCSARTVYRWDRGETEPRRLVIGFMQRAVAAAAASPRKSDGSSFTFIDLFAGIGGMRLAFQNTGGRCSYTSEWNKYSRRTYEANFGCGDHPIAGDITQVAEDEIPSHDVLLAGFPCQPFSIAGVSKKNELGRPHGFLCKTQGTLFFDVARIIAHHRPAAFLLENVKNLASHDKGKTLGTILDTLRDELGYSVQYRVVNAAGFVPQHRQRILLTGFREETAFDLRSVQFPDAAAGPKLRNILHPEDGSEEPEEPYTSGQQATVNPKYTLTGNLWRYLQEYKAKHQAKGNGFGFGLVGPGDIARTLSARYYKDGSEILIDTRGCVEAREPAARPRRLTPRECARLMGFDAPGRDNYRIPVSDTRAYQQFGNSVVVPVIETVAKAMHSHILRILSLEAKRREPLDHARFALPQRSMDTAFRR